MANTEPARTWVVNVLLAATPTSGPAMQSMVASAIRASEECGVLVTASTGPPYRRTAASTSAVSPDWENATVRVPGSNTPSCSEATTSSVGNRPTDPSTRRVIAAACREVPQATRRTRSNGGKPSRCHSSLPPARGSRRSSSRAATVGCSAISFSMKSRKVPSSTSEILQSARRTGRGGTSRPAASVQRATRSIATTSPSARTRTSRLRSSTAATSEATYHPSSALAITSGDRFAATTSWSEPPASTASAHDPSSWLTATRTAAARSLPWVRASSMR
jgi:hypothetical protein